MFRSEDTAAVQHLAGSELVCGYRLRLALAHDRPPRSATLGIPIHRTPPARTIDTRLALIAAVGALLACAAVALMVPVRRASRVDPITALR